MTQLNAAFWKWFGKSKVVDRHGQPLVVWHSSPERFTVFDTSKEGAHFGSLEQASALRKVNKRKPRAFFLSLSLPLRMIDLGVWSDFNGLHAQLVRDDIITMKEADIVWSAWQHGDDNGWIALKRMLLSKGYDGIVYENEQEGAGDSWIAFYPSQIKSVDNDGTWDADDPDIRSNPPDKYTVDQFVYLSALNFLGNPIQSMAVHDTHGDNEDVDARMDNDFSNVLSDLSRETGVPFDEARGTFSAQYDEEIKKEMARLQKYYAPRMKRGNPPRKPLLGGLFAEARKYSNFHDFEMAYIGEIKHGLYWHVTADPEFTIDPKKGPRDASSMAAGPSAAFGKLMITSHLDHWASFYGNARPYAALIDMSDVPEKTYRQVNRGMGNEFFVFDPSNARVVEVMSIAKARRLDRCYSAALPGSTEELESIYYAAHAEGM